MNISEVITTLTKQTKNSNFFIKIIVKSSHKFYIKDLNIQIFIK
jgi:hypothetical protein